jgi:hypothetical protein
MSAALQPDVWVEFTLVPYPVTTGTTYRWSTRALAFPTFIEGRVVRDGWGTIERALSDFAGNYHVGNFSFTVEDSDALIRNLLNEPATQYFTSQEATIKLLSEAGRKAGLNPRVVFRGQISLPRLIRGRRAGMELVDQIGSQMSTGNLDTPIAKHKITRDNFPDCPQSNLGRVYPIIYGEHSDAGAMTATGESAEKGLIPAIYVGSRTTNLDDPFSGTPTYLAPPTVTATVGGTPGTTTYYYGVTAHSAYGQTPIGTVVQVTTGPSTLSTTNYIVLTWPAQTGAIAYTVYGRNWALPSQKLGTVTTTTYTDTGWATPTAPGPPSVNTAQISNAADTTQDTDFDWDFYLVSVGVVEIHAWYAADMIAGQEPKRIKMPTSTAGVDFLIPGQSGWPHAQPYLVIDGVTVTGFYARGPRSQAHKDGVVTIALNVCGYDDVGDGSGVMIDAAFRCLQHMLNEFVFKDDGAGYSTGTWGPLETFSDGTAMIQTSTFDACEAVTIGFIGGTGYLAAWCISDEMSLREFLQRFCTTFTCFVGPNQYGQIVASIINDAAEPTAGTLYLEQVNVGQLEDPEIAVDEIENRISFRYDYDTDAQRYRGDLEVIQDLDSQLAYHSLRESGELELFCTRDRTTARDSMARRLMHRNVAPRYQRIVTNLAGQEDDLGSQIRLTHYDGPYAARPFLVMGSTLSPTGPNVSVTIRGFDLSAFIGNNVTLPQTVPFTLT